MQSIGSDSTYRTHDSMKVSRICGCGAIVKGSCDRCIAKRNASSDQLRGTTAERGYDHQWRKLSERFRKHNPLCKNCYTLGRVEPAVDVHHIKPIRTHPELRLEWENLMSLCRACHDMIEREENGKR